MVTPSVLPFENLPAGYPKLAGFMSKAKEHAIFRKFQSLNARNLLYYQSELTDLEAQLQQVDRDLDDTEPDALKSWNKFSAEKTREILVHKLRSTLADYNSAMLQYDQILNLGSPRYEHVQGLKEWIGVTSHISDLSAGYLERQITQGDLPASMSRSEENVMDLATLNRDADSLFARLMRKSFLRYVFMVRAPW
ncbi:hypothetical protein DL765_006280 [Monosporascus sp. GIB2]|nr:hypothetical protein DL765_006280 [Monosporascus sp. GIB2]